MAARGTIMAGCLVMTPRRCSSTRTWFLMSHPPVYKEESGRAAAAPPRIRITMFLWQLETGRSTRTGGGQDYGDSLLRLNTAGSLSAADYFTPCNQEIMFTTGQDLGSSAPVLLPDSAGSASQPHLMMGGAMNGSLYVLNRDSLGGYNRLPCPDSAVGVQVVPVGDVPIPPILSTPLFWNNAIYVAAGNDKLKAFPMTGGVLNESPLALQSPESLGPQEIGRAH